MAGGGSKGQQMMLRQTEVHLCHPCGVETHHIVILVRKPSPYQDDPHRKCKEFIAGAVKGWALGSFVASMDEFSRHLICENCGHKTIED